MVQKRVFFNWLLLGLTFLMNSIVFANNLSITGLWETIDDRTGQKKALVKLYQKNDELYGKIMKVYWKEGDSHQCIHCKGKLHNHPIEGMRFVWGLKQHSKLIWEKGSILDPHNGKIYQVRVKKNHDKLLVRAYLGAPILGRTQIWHRVS